MREADHLALMFFSGGDLDTVLNVLKVVGLLITAFATYLGTAREIKTPEKTLTKEGKIILVAGVVGFLVAAFAQLLDWRLATIHSHEAELKNHELLVGIDRSLRRLDTITMDATTDAPLHATLLEDLNADLTKQLIAFNKLPNRMKAEPWHGFREVDEHQNIDANGARGPRIETLMTKESDWVIDPGLAQALFEASRPSIAIYKTPIDASSLSYKTFPQSPAPDLLLTPTGGDSVAVIEADYDLKKKTITRGPTISVTTTNMSIPASTWRASMNVESLDDLRGAQMIIFSAFQVRYYDTDAWFSSSNPRLNLYINHHRIPITGLKRIGGDNGGIGFEAVVPRDLGTPSRD